MAQSLEDLSSLPLIRLTTLGPFVCERLERQQGGEPIYRAMPNEEWQRRGKALTMLKVLLCQRNRRATRDALIDWLWTEEEQHEMKDARGALKTTAVVLRDLLRVWNEDSLLITLSMSDELMLAEQQRLWVDADAFEGLVHDAVRTADTDDALPLWERAYALARGEFLADEPYSEWTRSRREILRGKQGQCVTMLADMYTAQGRLNRAQELLWEAVLALPVDEDALCRLLALLEQQERYHDAWRLYKLAKDEVAKDERRLTPRVRTLAKRIHAKLVEIEPYALTSSNSTTVISTQLQSLRPMPIKEALRLNSRVEPLKKGSFTKKQQGHVWLTLGASSLGQLLNEGWSTDGIFASLKVVLEGVQAMPVNTQRQALQFTATSMIADLPLTTGEDVSEEERAILCERLGKSIGDAWKLFHSSDATQLLTIGQSLLSLVQYNHSHLYPEVQPLFYSTVYMLIGATQYILGRYKEAQKTLDTAYIASLESADTWIVAQVLSWQAYVYEALGQRSDAIHIVDRALGVLSHHEDGEYLRLRLRLLAFSAEMSASLGDRADVQRRLDDAEKYVDSFSVPHEEFDTLSWLQHTGTCALNLGYYPVAVENLQQSLNRLPSQWKLRYISTAISLVKALIHTHDLGGVVEVSQKTIPMIQSVQARVFAQKLVAYLQEDLLDAFPQEASCRTFVAEVQQQLTQLGKAKEQ